MANFDWVNELGPSEWKETNGQNGFKLEVAELRRRSGLDSAADWKTEFKIWASGQKRDYRALPMINVASGQELAVMLVYPKEQDDTTPDFSWLNDIPDNQWGAMGTGQFKTFGLQQFMDESNATMQDVLNFDQWGQAQARNYRAEVPEMLNDAQPIVLVLWPAI